MTELVIAAPSAGLRLPSSAPGAGDDARTIHGRILEAARHRLASTTGGGAWLETIEQIGDLEVEAAQYDWDSRGSEALDPLSVHHSLRFLIMLPPNVPAPHVSADPDGSVAFDWQTPASTFSISFGSDQTLTYAGVFPLARTRGVEYLGDRIPSPILDGIRRALNPQ